MKLKKILENFCKKNPAVVVTILYFVIAMVFSYPLIGNIGSELPQGRGDTFQAMSNIDSRVDAVRMLDFGGKMSFFVKNIGVHLPYVILNLFFNKYLAYNLMFFLSFVLSGLGAYLLAFYFTKNKNASFLAGLIFAFSPFHFYQSTVVNLGTMQQQWLPFLVLFLFRFFEKLELKYFVSFVFFAFLVAMSEHQMLAFAALFIVLVAAYKIIIDRSLLRNKKLWVFIVCSIGLLAVVAFGMFGNMLKVATSENNFLNAGENAANKYAMGFFEPFMPPIFHSLWPGVSEFLQTLVLGESSRGSYFLGFSVIAVLGYFAWMLKKKRVAEIKEKTYRNNLIFWSVASLVFYIFSLGNSFSLGKFTIYLPYYLIYKFLPFYENIRTTGRMFIFVELGVSVLFAFGFSELLKKYQQKKNNLTLIFSLIILLEFWVAPIRLMSVSYSPFYDQIAKDGQQYNLIEIPGSTSYDFASYDLFLNTVAKKPVLNGMPLARKISGQFDMQQETPIIKQLLYTIPKGNDPETKNNDDILKGFDWSQATDILNYYTVGYITVSKEYTKDSVQKLAKNFIEKFVSFSDYYEDKYLFAYKVKKQDPAGFFAQLMNKNLQFSDTFKGTDGKMQREVGDGAQIKIVNMESAPKKVSITVTAQAASPLKLNLIGDLVAEKDGFLVNKKLEKYSFEATLAKGENILKFGVADQNGKPVLARVKKKDPKRALIVSEILIENK